MVPVRRHARDRRVCIARGGLVLAGALLIAEANPLHAQGIGQPRKHGQHGLALSPRSERKEAPVVIPVAPRPLVYTYSCANPENAEQENLCIGRRAAKAAEDQAKAGADQAAWAENTFWIGLAGTIAVVLTLAYTAKAANAAPCSAQAAIDATVAAQSSAEAAREQAAISTAAAKGIVS